MRPTTKDLAEAAGVSLATVDRVLNDRPNVSAKSQKKVLEAIEKTGFVRNTAAGNLARNKTYQFHFILPTEGDQYLLELLAQIQHAKGLTTPEMIQVKTDRIPMDDPHSIANYLGSISADQVDGVAIMAPESPQVRDALTRMDERGIKVVQFLSGQENTGHFDFVGVDNYAAGATAGRLIGRFLPDTTGRVMVISETMRSLDSIQRRLGFDSILNARFPNLHPLPSLETYGNDQRAEKIIARQLENETDIVGLYVLSSEARVPLEMVARARDLRTLMIVVHERTPFSEEFLQGEQIDAIIAQNPGHAVRSALNIMQSRIEKRSPSEQVQLRIEILLMDNL